MAFPPHRSAGHRLQVSGCPLCHASPRASTVSPACPAPCCSRREKSQSGGLYLPKTKASWGAHLCPGWLPPPGVALPTIRAAPVGASPVQALPGHKSGCAVLAVTLVSQRQVRESDNGPSTPQGGLGVHRSLCVKQGVTSTRVPSKVLPCSQNKHAVGGGAGRVCCGGGLSPLHHLVSPGLGRQLQAGAWMAGGW